MDVEKESPANAGLFCRCGQFVDVTRNKSFYFIWLSTEKCHQ
nr:MAG TPA_asm: hypothetical protein [Caudoviricetes sp.]